MEGLCILLVYLMQNVGYVPAAVVKQLKIVDLVILIPLEDVLLVVSSVL